MSTIIDKAGLEKTNKTKTSLKLGKIFSLIGVTAIIMIILLNLNHINIQQPKAEAAADSMPVGQFGDWSLIFSDEFSGTSLDLNAWEPSWFTGTNISPPINSEEAACYDPAQVSVNEGTLKLVAGTTDNPMCLTRSGTQAGYASGMVNSRNSFLFAYGYYEARILLPGSSNGDLHNWGAFWSAGLGQWPATGEIDVMESLSSHMPCSNYHYQDSSGANIDTGANCVRLADPTGWHTYAAYWEPGRITFYYDGVPVETLTEGVINANHFLILNYGLNERYGIYAPSTMQVDYVRVWKAVTPTPNLLQNGSFEDGTSPWFLNVTSPASATVTRATGSKVDGSASINVNIEGTSPNYWYVQFRQDDLELITGKTYELSFWAKASRKRPIQYVIQQSGGTHALYVNEKANLSRSWRKFTITYTATTSQPKVFLGFNLAQSEGEVWIDNVSLVSN